VHAIQEGELALGSDNGSTGTTETRGLNRQRRGEQVTKNRVLIYIDLWLPKPPAPSKAGQLEMQGK